MARRDEGATTLISMVVALGLLGMLTVSLAMVVNYAAPERTTVEHTNAQDLADAALRRLSTTTGEPPAWSTVAGATAIGLLDHEGARNIARTSKIQALDGATAAQLRQKRGLPDNVGINVTVTWLPMASGFSSRQVPWYVGSSTGTEAQWLRSLMPGYRGWNGTDKDAADPEEAAPEALYRTEFDTIRDTDTAITFEQALVWAAGFDAWATESTDAQATGGNSMHWRLYPSSVFTGAAAGAEVFLAVGNPDDTNGNPLDDLTDAPAAWKIHREPLQNHTATLFLSAVDLDGLTNPQITLSQIVRGHQENPIFTMYALVYAREHGKDGTWTLVEKWDRKDTNWELDTVGIPASLRNKTVDLAFTYAHMCNVPVPASSCDNTAKGWFVRRLWVNGTRDGSPANAYTWAGTIARYPPAVLVGSGTNTAGWNETWTIKYALDLLQDKGTRFLVLGQDTGEQPDWLWHFSHGQYAAQPVASNPDVLHLLLTNPHEVDVYSLGSPAGYAYSGSGERPVRDTAGNAMLLWDQTAGLVLTTFRPATAGGLAFFENLLTASLVKAETVTAGTHAPEGVLLGVARGRIGVAPDLAESMPGAGTVTVKIWLTDAG